MMNVSNRRDLNLAMDRQVRQIRRENRCYAKQTSSAARALLDAQGKVNGTTDDVSDSWTDMLKKSRYSMVQKISQDMQEKAKALSAGQENASVEDAAKGMAGFAGMYNSLLEQMAKADDTAMERYIEEMKKLSEKYKEKFNEYGITVGSNGALSVAQKDLSGADMEPWYDFLAEASSFAKKVEEMAGNELGKLGSSQSILGTLYDQFGKETV